MPVVLVAWRRPGFEINRRSRPGPTGRACRNTIASQVSGRSFRLTVTGCSLPEGIDDVARGDSSDVQCRTAAEPQDRASDGDAAARYHAGSAEPVKDRS